MTFNRWTLLFSAATCGLLTALCGLGYLIETDAHPLQAVKHFIMDILGAMS